MFGTFIKNLFDSFSKWAETEETLIQKLSPEQAEKIIFRRDCMKFALIVGAGIGCYQLYKNQTSKNERHKSLDRHRDNYSRHILSDRRDDNYRHAGDNRRDYNGRR